MAVRIPYDSSTFNRIPESGSDTGAFAIPRYPSAPMPSAPAPTEQNYDFGGAFEPEYAAPAGGTPSVPATAVPTTPTAVSRSVQPVPIPNFNPPNVPAIPAPQPAAAAPTTQPTQLSLRQDQIAAMSQQSAPIGFDAAKWADAGHQTDKYVAGKLAQAGNSMTDIVAALNANGNTTYQQYGDDSVVDMRDGNIYDVWFDFDNASGQKHPQWTLVGNVRDGGAGGAAGAAGGGVGGSPARTTAPGGAAIPSWLQSVFGGDANGGAFLPGGFTDEGADPMSQLIDSGNAGLILNGGSTPFGNSLQAQLLQLIQNGGVSPDIATKLIGAREDAALAQRSMLEDARAALAGQGILSAPGVDQGATTDAIGRISEKIAPEFAGAVRDIYGQALDESNQSFMSALQMATGLSDSQSKTLLAALGQGTSRQQVLAGIALDNLSANMDWNKFLAQHSLDQTKLAEDISQGRMTQVIQLLQLFLQGAGTAAGGYY